MQVLFRNASLHPTIAPSPFCFRGCSDAAGTQHCFSQVVELLKQNSTTGRIWDDAMKSVCLCTGIHLAHVFLVSERILHLRSRSLSTPAIWMGLFTKFGTTIHTACCSSTSLLMACSFAELACGKQTVWTTLHAGRSKLEPCGTQCNAVSQHERSDKKGVHFENKKKSKTNKQHCCILLNNGKSSVITTLFRQDVPLGRR